MAELPHVGKHCDVKSCNRLDFLPFNCDGCGNSYCLEHKGKDDHQCIMQLLEVSARPHDGSKGFDCSLTACDKRELTPIFCEHCHLSFCLSHRHQENHVCVNLRVAPVPNSKTAEHIAKILANKTPVESKKLLKSVRAQQIAARVTLMKMKGKAEGDRRIPESHRVFFSIMFPRTYKLGPKPVFVSKIWIIGRVIDYLTDFAGINNPNNTGALIKLRLFTGDGGILLPVDRKVEEILTDEFGVYSGSSLILELVDQTVSELPNVQDYAMAS